MSAEARIRSHFEENIAAQKAASETLPGAIEKAARLMARSLLNNGKIIADGDADAIRDHPHPIVQQFIHGEVSEDDLAVLRMSGEIANSQFSPRDFER